MELDIYIYWDCDILKKLTICIPFSPCYFRLVILSYKSDMVEVVTKKGKVRLCSFAGAQLINGVTCYNH